MDFFHIQPHNEETSHILFCTRNLSSWLIKQFVLFCLQKCGYGDSFIEGTVMCFLNCSWRGHSGSSIGCVHFTEVSIATCSPCNTHLVEASAHLRDSIKVRPRNLDITNIAHYGSTGLIWWLGCGQGGAVSVFNAATSSKPTIYKVISKRHHRSGKTYNNTIVTHIS